MRPFTLPCHARFPRRALSPTMHILLNSVTLSFIIIPLTPAVELLTHMSFVLSSLVRVYRESKAVNAWFANKRSASKKKIKAPAHPFTTTAPSLSTRTARDDDSLIDAPYTTLIDNSRMSTPFGSQDYSPFPAFDADHHHNRHVFDSEISTGSPRRMRIRPTPKQTEELRRLYSTNTHPSREEREALGDRIGM